MGVVGVASLLELLSCVEPVRGKCMRNSSMRRDGVLTWLVLSLHILEVR